MDFFSEIIMALWSSGWAGKFLVFVGLPICILLVRIIDGFGTSIGSYIFSKLKELAEDGNLFRLDARQISSETIIIILIRYSMIIITFFLLYYILLF